VTAAPIPPAVIDGCLAAVGLIGKYADHLPLYRLEQIAAHDQVNLSRSTACRHIAKLDRLANNFKGHRYRYFATVMQGIKQVNTFHHASFAMIIMPAHDLVLIGPFFLLNRVVKNQAAGLSFICRTVDLTWRHKSFEV
jgi:hypothetical protein